MTYSLNASIPILLKHTAGNNEENASKNTESVGRICHEIEFESCKTLEAPCSCSGTVKYAHRDCIQRWCEEKGDTTCEICLQNFEPGYTVPVDKVLLDGSVTIRGSLLVPRRGQGGLDEQLITSEFSSNRWNCFRVVALIFTILFLLQHVFTLLVGATENFPFSLFILLVAKTTGIVLPIYVMILIVRSIRKSLRNRHQYEAPEEVQPSSESGGGEEAEAGAEAEDHLEHRVEIHST
ncbi:uncharacterized protein LOC108212439 isoform X1 [Daucus carota subsp. sativus]|uniref:uncharacterized protein LOC108212439 isoform X1 n=1 Tax=Daucus carota subsp. sativus TaxID=79200 RepID=UPI003083A563